MFVHHHEFLDAKKRLQFSLDTTLSRFGAALFRAERGKFWTNFPQFCKKPFPMWERGMESLLSNATGTKFSKCTMHKNIVLQKSSSKTHSPPHRKWFSTDSRKISSIFSSSRMKKRRTKPRKSGKRRELKAFPWYQGITALQKHALRGLAYIHGLDFVLSTSLRNWPIN